MKSSVIPFPGVCSGIQHYYIPKNGMRTITFAPEITGYIVWYMDAVYTEIYQVTFGSSRPMGFKPTTGTALDYIQKFEYPDQNIMIEGHYWFEFFVVKADSYLTTDK